MATVYPFLRVPDVAHAKAWYEQIGFKCLGTHEEPGCGLDWAMMSLDDAIFMLYPHLPDTIVQANNCGLYFNLGSIDHLTEVLRGKAQIVEIIDRTEYGKQEVTIKDGNGFQVTFACDA